MSPAPDGSLRLAAADLLFAVRGRRLIDGVGLRVEPGEMLAIVGPNGAGKTTLLRLLSGVLPAAGGSVLLDGRALGSVSRREVARRLAYLPQETWTAFDLTVEDVVALGRFAHVSPWRGFRREDRARIEQAMARMGLETLRRRVLTTLSGGERQRVFLARALAQEAPLLLLDEPTRALDVGHQLELMELLVGLHREGRTVVAAMHDLHLVWRWFPRAVLLQAGRAVLDGSARDVLLAPELGEAFGVRVTAGSPDEVHFERHRDGGGPPGAPG